MHLAIAFGLIAAHKSWKVRFMSAADLVIALEAVQRQGRVKEVMHRTVAMPKLPDIVEAIVEGRQPRTLTVKLLLQGVPLDWSDQRAAFGLR